MLLLVLRVAVLLYPFALCLKQGGQALAIQHHGAVVGDVGAVGVFGVGVAGTVCVQAG